MAYTTIDNPELYFQTKLYSGNEADDHAITLDGSENMQPDLVWIKCRSNTGWSHNIYDAVRGANKYIRSNQTIAEVTVTDALKRFDTEGFTVDDNASNDEVNDNAKTYVAWCWKAGTTSGITTTGANITPSAYSMNATSGISIIKYEGEGNDGTNTAHALGAVPHMIIVKRLENSNYWAVYHHKTNEAPDDYLVFNTNAVDENAPIWKDTDPTSVYYRTDNSTSVNASGEDMVAYLFTSIQGYSKFGSYTGNGNADGTFVYTGFKPAFIMIKRTDSTGNWVIHDAKRYDHIGDHKRLFANTDNSETDDWYLDLLSNGFKIRNTEVDENTSGATYVYAAFAEAPFVNSNGVPCTAR